VKYNLTRRQKELLEFLVLFEKENDGLMPTLKEMQSALGIKSRGLIHRRLKHLEDRGWIARLPYRVCAITLL